MDQPDARIIPIVSSEFEHRNLFTDDLLRHICHCLYKVSQAQALASLLPVPYRSPATGVNYLLRFDGEPLPDLVLHLPPNGEKPRVLSLR